MPITHHPSDETVLRYVAGDMAEGFALVVATHAALCAPCHRRVETCEQLGGALLSELPPAALDAGARERLLARLDGPSDERVPPSSPLPSSSFSSERTPAPHAGSPGAAPHDAGQPAQARRVVRPARPDLPEQAIWPAPLRAYAIGQWRFLAPGVKWCSVDLSRPARGAGASAGRGPDVSVMLLRAAAGTVLPSHGHRGAELTCILTGSFSDETGRFEAGDLVEADEELDHQPVAGPEAECVCLIAVEGKLRLHSLLGRLLQPFFGV